MSMFKKSSGKKPVNTKPGWKVLIVDDEKDIHTITKIALSGVMYDDRGIEFLHAYSGEEAKKIFSEVPDIGLVFLDVVMESEDAGLMVAKYVREDLDNHFVRIVLRTGQPGQAPERDVIVDYDINDYKEKTNLSSDKLFAVTYASLRGYKDILTVERSRLQLESHRQGLERIIDATANLFKLRSLKQFADGLLVQLASILHIENQSLLVRVNSCTVRRTESDFEVIAGSGIFDGDVESSGNISSGVRSLLIQACEKQCSIFEAGAFVGYFPTLNAGANLIYLDGVDTVDALDKQLIEVFSNNITIAFDNLYLDREIYETQVEIINTLGDVVESRSKEAANHVKRVAHLSKALGEWAGLSKELADELFMAAPMHDVGKVAIPDSVLLKPGKLDEAEWEIMRSHVEIGQEIFSRSKRPVLKAASIVAGQHHERFDGKGYPKGIAGDDIHIYGRIVALVDVYDALSHSRCYKDSWPHEKVVSLLEEEAGQHFDPNLVKLFLSNMDKVQVIMQQYPD